MKRTKDVIEYINNVYYIDRDKYDVVKIGQRVWLYVVTKECKLARGLIFVGSIETTETSNTLKKYLEHNIAETLKTYNYYKFNR